MHNITAMLSKLFELSLEAVIAIDGNKILYKNPAADTLLSESGLDSADDVQNLFPEFLFDQTCDSFIASVVIGGNSVTVRVSTIGDVRVLSLRYAGEDTLQSLPVSASVLATLRSEMFNLKLAADQFVGKPGNFEDAKQRSYASVLYHSYYSLLRLIGNIDTANNIALGEMTVFKRPTDIVRLCCGLVDSIYHFLLDEGITVQFETELSSFVADVDAWRVEQLLLNLISNSIKHTDKGGTIRLSLKPAGDNFILSLDDDGEGIPPEILSSVFSRFREVRPLSGLTDGVGLGLFIAKGIAESHSGALIIESRKNGGTRARVMLPVGNVDGMLAEPSAPYEGSLSNVILTELSDVFDAGKYTEKFLD